MEPINRATILDDIWRINKKADLMRSIHGAIADRLQFFNTVSTIYVTFGSAVGTTVIFAKIPDEYFLLFGLYSASVFIVSLLPTALNINKHIEDRVKALNLYTLWIRDAQNFANVESLIFTVDQMQFRQKELIESYKKITENTVNTSNSKFNKFKQKHLQKIHISKELDKNPFESIRKIRKRLSKEYADR